MKLLIAFFGIVSIVFINGCVTLNLTPEQAMKEYARVNENTINEYYDFRLGLLGVALKGGGQFKNGLEYIVAFDKEGRHYKVFVDDKTTLRIIKKNGRKVNLYFDTSFLKDSCLFGQKSHFLNLPAGPYKITEVEAIQIQTSSGKIERD